MAWEEQTLQSKKCLGEILAMMWVEMGILNTGSTDINI